MPPVQRLEKAASPSVASAGANGFGERLLGSFRKRLLLGILLLNLIVATAAALALYESYKGVEDDAVVATQNLANLLAHDLTASLDKVDLAVQSVADEVERQLVAGGIDAASLNAYIDRRAAPVTELDRLRILDRDGVIKYGQRVSSPTPLSAAKREYFIELRDNPRAGLVISKPMTSYTTGQPFIVLARRISSPNGDFQGVAYAVIYLDTFKRRFSELDLGDHGAVSLGDIELRTVVRHPEPRKMETAVGNPAYSKEWPEKLKEDRVAGSYFAVGLDDLRRALSYHRVDKYPFYVVVGMLPSDYLAGWKQDLLRTVLLVVLFALVTLFFARAMRDAWDSLTERKRAQQFLQSAYEQEQEVRVEAERVGRLKDEFVANLSHELRTPVSSIIGWSEILRRRSSGTRELDEGLRAIERNARVQGQMIDDLLDMQRIVSGQVRLDPKPVNLVSLVQDVVETTRPTAHAKQIAVATTFDPNPGCVRGDPMRIQQIIWNVLNNAVKFTPPRGEIHIAVERSDAHVTVSVSDSGPGIDAHFLPHVFDRFRPSEPSHSHRQAGLGLGLAIARHLVELHGGFIYANSAGKGQGSTFTVGFPALPAVCPSKPRDVGGHEPDGIPQPS